MNPQQPNQPIGPPPSPVGPDMVVPSNPNAIPSVNIQPNSAPQYDPNYVPPVPSNSSGPKLPSIASEEEFNPNALPNIEPMVSQAPVGPIDINNNASMSNKSDIVRKVAILLGGLLLLGLLLFVLWWFLIRSSNSVSQIENFTDISRTSNGLDYNYKIADNSSEDVNSKIELTDPLDSYAFSRVSDGGQDFLGQSFVESNSKDKTSAEIYTEEYKTELIKDVENAYGLSSVTISDPIAYPSESLEDGITVDVTGSGKDGINFQGRVLTALSEERAYSLLALAPAENWSANTSAVSEMFASLSIGSASNTPLVEKTGDEFNVDLSIAVDEVISPATDGVSLTDVLEYSATVTNNGPDAAKASSIEAVFSVGSEIVEIVSINDPSEAFSCDAAVGERTSISGEMLCTITTDLSVGESLVLGLRYKHVNEFNTDTAAEFTLRGLDLADWIDSNTTQDSSNATTYTSLKTVAIVEEEVEEITAEVTNEEPQEASTPEVTNKSGEGTPSDLPDTAGGENVAIYAPLLVIVLSSAALLTSRKKSYQSFNG